MHVISGWAGLEKKLVHSCKELSKQSINLTQKSVKMPPYPDHTLQGASQLSLHSLASMMSN